MAPHDEQHRDWSEADVGDQSGRVVVITGANTGIGYETAAVLAHRGAHVVLAVRDLEKGNAALSRIVAASPNADVTLQQLDLASLASVRLAAEALRAAYPRIDLLINNAGVMWTPKQVTEDGFELQFGTNHLGHFALTGLLLDHLLGVRDSRVVTVSSLGHRLRAAIHFDDLHWERRYDRVAAYGQSKLANLLFTSELQRRLTAAGSPLRALAAHPGYSHTNLQGASGRKLGDALMSAATRVVATDADFGARQTLYAASQDLPGDTFVGPRFGYLGRTQPVGRSRRAKDAGMAAALWALSEQLTKTEFPL